jgi:hypothetical protein
MSASFPIEIMKEVKGNSQIFFETGTSEGDTVKTALECGFTEIYSSEIDKATWERSRARFVEEKNVAVMLMSSIEALSMILPNLDLPLMVFLDAHPDCTSGPSPILEELDLVLKYPGKLVIAADDMRLMGLYRWSASTVEVIIDKILSAGRRFRINRRENGHRFDDLLVAQEE